MFESSIKEEHCIVKQRKTIYIGVDFGGEVNDFFQNIWKLSKNKISLPNNYQIVSCEKLKYTK